MFWQLWVLVTVVAIGVLIFVTMRFRHAQKVFDHIIQLDDPAPRPERDALAHDVSARDIPVRDARVHDVPVDELARRRRTRPALVPHQAHPARPAHPRSRQR